MNNNSNSHSFNIKTSNHGDEYITLQKSVDLIVPYIQKTNYKTIWCPFDTEDSLFVKTFKQIGYTVNYGHIETGQDFFNYDLPQGDIVVSNPPFSKISKILNKLLEWDLPFALIANSNGIFDSKSRADLFRKYRIELLVPRGRMKFIHRSGIALTSPNFQSIYVCHKVLDQQITFDEMTF